MANNYKRAIEILSQCTSDQAERILYKIAANAPAAVVNAVDGDKKKAIASADAKLKTECRAILLTKGLVPSVRRWREATGASLVEAKAAVDALR